MNKAIIMGRLTRDPEIRWSTGEKARAIGRFTVAALYGTKRLFILPVALHECILMPEASGCVEELQEMIGTINDYDIEIKDILSYSLYYYDVETGYGRY